MYQFYSIKDYLARCSQNVLGERVELKGWVRTTRTTKVGVIFIDLTDGSTLQPVQVIFDEQLPNYETVKQVTSGCSITVRGKVVPSPGAKQSVELSAETIEVMGWVEDPATYPIAPKHHTLDFLRTVPHLRPRTRLFQAITQLRSSCAFALHEFFQQSGFQWLPAPILTGSDCEGAGELFEVRSAYAEAQHEGGFFGRPAYLTVSGQLNAEAFACAVGKIYTFGPTFRAENSNTTRHLSEFWMLEPEVAFADLDAIIEWAKKMLSHLANRILANHEDLIQFFESYTNKALQGRLAQFNERGFERITYTQAIDVLIESKTDFQHPVHWGIDLATEHERFLSETYFQAPVVVTDYPQEIKAFYMRQNADGRTVAAMDVLVPGLGEMIGGSQREERLAFLDRRMNAMGIPTEGLQWYRDLRRYGTVVHAGFGLGFERLLAYVSGLDNLRDLTPFARAPGLIPC